jgi:hypothetical protein
MQLDIGTILAIFGFSYICGFILGFDFGKIRETKRFQKEFDALEQHTYCEGFKNGVFYVIDDQGKKIFKKEIALRSYRDYKISNINQH